MEYMKQKFFAKKLINITVSVSVFDFVLNLQVRIYLHMVNHLNVRPYQISILSQYKAQCSEIEHNLKSVGIEHPNVNTVVASQGKFIHFLYDFIIRTFLGHLQCQ